MGYCAQLNCNNNYAGRKTKLLVCPVSRRLTVGSKTVCFQIVCQCMFKTEEGGWVNVPDVNFEHLACCVYHCGNLLMETVPRQTYRVLTSMSRVINCVKS